MRYLDVAEELRRLIGTGGYGAGGALPSEAELQIRFGASRATIRRALEHLRADGLVVSRKGSGWYAAVDPIRQALGRFPTVEAALAATGVDARREILEFGFETPPDDVTRALGQKRGAEVLRVRRRNLARREKQTGWEPFGIVTVWVPAHVGAALSRTDVERSTFYELLAREGAALGSAVQTITAEPATTDDERHLGVAKGSPILVCHRVTSDAGGQPVLCSEHRYPAHRTCFEVELPGVAHTGEGPAGLRLVEGSAGRTSRRVGSTRARGDRHG
ncbi:MAG: GntR family transcriptional regulator [Actinobacteria bacterium]|nr:GntR family transcriptional regulator [Actinomycetota bacterium]